MFSFYLNTEGKDSYIYFGGYEETILKDPFWIELTEDTSHWAMKVEYVFQKGEKGIDLKKFESIVDSGTSLMYFPTK